MTSICTIPGVEVCTPDVEVYTPDVKMCTPDVEVYTPDVNVCTPDVDAGTLCSMITPDVDE